jgi:hypothetical protein
MANKVPIPFTGLEMDPTDPKSVAMTFLVGIAGFASLFMVQDLGGNVKSTVSETIGLGSDSNEVDLL